MFIKMYLINGIIYPTITNKNSFHQKNKYNKINFLITVKKQNINIFKYK